jgi:hypothetical protein
VKGSSCEESFSRRDANNAKTTKNFYFALLASWRLGEKPYFFTASELRWGAQPSLLPQQIAAKNRRKRREDAFEAILKPSPPRIPLCENMYCPLSNAQRDEIATGASE